MTKRRRKLRGKRLYAADLTFTPKQRAFYSAFLGGGDVHIDDLYSAYTGREDPELKTFEKQQRLSWPVLAVNRKIKEKGIKIGLGEMRRTYRLEKI